MSANSFRFDSARLRSAFAPRKPRHPLLRVAFGLVGVALLCLLVFFSVFVGAAMIAAGVLYKLVSQRGRPVVASRNAKVVEGEYRVVRKPVLPMSR
jgi:energy-converting hydrogenase Eha subunit G